MSPEGSFVAWSVSPPAVRDEKYTCEKIKCEGGAAGMLSLNSKVDKNQNNNGNPHTQYQTFSYLFGEPDEASGHFVELFVVAQFSFHLFVLVQRLLRHHLACITSEKKGKMMRKCRRGSKNTCLVKEETSVHEKQNNSSSRKNTFHSQLYLWLVFSCFARFSCCLPVWPRPVLHAVLVHINLLQF